MDSIENDRNIKYTPENYDQMLDKLQKREKEQEEIAFRERNVNTKEELVRRAEKEIQQDFERRQQDRKPLSSSHVITDASSKDIQDLRRQLNDEIRAFALNRLQKTQEDQETQEKPSDLKGRVTQKKEDSSGSAT